MASLWYALPTTLVRPPAALRADASVINRTTAKDLPVDRLKVILLECDSHAASRTVDFTTAAYCSIAYEELLRRGFGGDFNRLLEWWRQNRKERAQSH